MVFPHCPGFVTRANIAKANEGEKNLLKASAVAKLFRLAKRYRPSRLILKFLVIVSRVIGRSFWTIARFRFPPTAHRDAAGPRVWFFPYGTRACQLQHAMFGAYLSSRGAVVRQVDSLERRQQVDQIFREKAVNSDFTGEKRFRSVPELMDYLQGLGNGDAFIARGIVDSYLKMGTIDEISTRLAVSANFENWVLSQIEYGKNVASMIDGVICGDSSYLPNRSILGACISSGKPAWVLNPSGLWKKIELDSDEVFSRLLIEDIEKRAQEAAESKSARTGSNWPRPRKVMSQDERNASLGDASIPNSLIGRKVVFLHIFRDANGMPLTSEEGNRVALFRSYLEWADALFSQISIDPESWAYREHPSSHYYPGDREILLNLLRRHGLQNLQNANGVAVGAILSRKLPVYTHSGSIVLEAAVAGYKAHTCSLLYPEEFSKPSLTHEAFLSAVSLPFSEAVEEIRPANYRHLAKLAQSHRKHQETFPLLPSKGEPNRDSPLHFLASDISQLGSLGLQILSPGIDKRLEEPSQQLLSLAKPSGVA